jgi:hypothetical protein
MPDKPLGEGSRKTDKRLARPDLDFVAASRRVFRARPQRHDSQMEIMSPASDARQVRRRAPSRALGSAALRCGGGRTRPRKRLIPKDGRLGFPPNERPRWQGLTTVWIFHPAPSRAGRTRVIVLILIGRWAYQRR